MFDGYDQTSINRFLSHIEAGIQEFGYTFSSHGVGDMGDVEFSYTVGLADRETSDLVMLGYSPEKCTDILDFVAKNLGRGRIVSEPCRLTDALEGIDVMLVPMPASDAVKLAEVLKYRVGPCSYIAPKPEGGYDPDVSAQDVHLVQVILPDAQGRFPEDHGCDPKVSEMQNYKNMSIFK